jgi:hypothetical protein
MEKPSRERAVLLLVRAVRAAVMSAAEAGDGRVRLKDGRALADALKVYETSKESHDHECG